MGKAMIECLNLAIAAALGVAPLALPPVSYLDTLGHPSIRGAYVREWREGKPVLGHILLNTDAPHVLAEELTHHYQHMLRLPMSEGANRFDLGDREAGPIARKAAEFCEG